MSGDSSHDSNSSLAGRFARLRRTHDSLPDPFEFLQEHPQAGPEDIIAVIVVDQSQRWRAGCGRPVEEYLDRYPQLRAHETHLLQLVVAEYQLATETGRQPGVEDFVSRFPDLKEQIRHRLQNDQQPGPTAILQSKDTEAKSQPGGTEACAPTQAASDEHRPPETIGRFRIQRILGDGGFGRVYLAFDEDLRRSVAIKIPHEYRVSSQEDINAYFDEARILASLDHPAIVPVFDFGRTDDGRCYCVTKYIEGSDLASRNRRAPLAFSAATELVANVADALHYSHLQRVVHRDIKPANILIDTADRPYITDFGIALREEDWGKDSPTAGTPAYMSPEQIRGEGHLVDGRTDIFSLGVVLYELLSGKRPFGRSWKNRMAATEARPLRQIDDSIPAELERICLKAMSHRVSDRYNTARDMADDLRHALDRSPRSAASLPRASQLSSDGHRVTSDMELASAPFTIVPKGLRSFDHDDAGFFLELLPGARDRYGIPESVRFWKNRVTSENNEDVFRVGLVYGPSGCGKSSFLKAGVLPLLPDTVTPVYVESTPWETELRLLEALRRACPGVPQGLELAETMTVLRRDHLLPAGNKLLIVIDQFEQWLHARPDIESDQLLLALRQCDGAHTQCIISVRDDFWMAVTHFMEDLDVALIPGRNLAALDLFSIRHARKVLTAMGRAYGVLETGHNNVDRQEKRFIRKAVDELAENGSVIPVHLALFAEMVKDKAWTPATLQELGGTEGVGVTFLEETFNGRMANPHHRLHQKGARAVLGALLSEQSGDIKGQMCSYQELLQRSGYDNRRDAFDVLLRILDSDLRLITPTDPAGAVNDEPVSAESQNEERYYHLTHDYLVPSLNEWLSRKQKETRRGRAELLLSRRAASWQASPSSRTLPSFFEWLRILTFAPRYNRAHLAAERQMMRSASRYFWTRILAVAAVLIACAWWISDSIPRSEARSLVIALETADTQDVPVIIQRLEPVRPWAEPLLRSALNSADPDSADHLHLSLAMLPSDVNQQEYLFERVLSATPTELHIIRRALIDVCDRTQLSDHFQPVVRDTNQLPDRRFRAAAVLAGTNSATEQPNSEWIDVSDFLAEQLISTIADNQNQFNAWTELFRHITGPLSASLRTIYSREDRSELERTLAASILNEYIADQPRQLVELLLQATPQQHRTLFPALALHRTDAVRLLRPIADRHPSPDMVNDARSQAHAAALLFALDEIQPAITALARTDDPERTAFLERRLAALTLQPDILQQQLKSADSAALTASLLKALGGFEQHAVTSTPSDFADSLTAEFESLYRRHPDSGVHSAAEWALKRWNHPIALEPQDDSDRQWSVNRQGQTMVRFYGPFDYMMGSPEGETGRGANDERLHEISIDRSFAISSTEVTQEQFIRFMKDYRFKGNAKAPTLQCPVISVTWIQAARYCQWLCEQEEIPPEEWPYPNDIEIDFGMVLPDDFLDRTGYRLPTEAEWEYACRCGTTTPYSFGTDTQLLGEYAWYNRSSGQRTWPVGSLKPNPRGLFDMHGNVYEHCHNIYSNRIMAYDIGETRPVRSPAANGRRIFENASRGGSYAATAEEVRSANRRGDRPDDLNYSLGFRVAKTVSSAADHR